MNLLRLLIAINDDLFQVSEAALEPVAILWNRVEERLEVLVPVATCSSTVAAVLPSSN